MARTGTETASLLAESVAPGVVAVGRDRRGQGVVIAGDKVVTNGHNLRGRETTIWLRGQDPSTGQVLGVDHEGDLALIEVATGAVTAPAWAPADQVVALGDPAWTLTQLLGGGARVTSGTVTALDRRFRGPLGRPITGAFEHSAPLSRGSSGSPVINAEGQIIGFNTHRLGDGLYLAIPATAALRERLDSLRSGDAAPSPRLGVGLAPPWAASRLRQAVGLPAVEGLLIRTVADDSPAARAGLNRGDVLITAAGQPLRSLDDLFNALAAAGPGGSLELGVLRGVEERTVTVTLES